MKKFLAIAILLATQSIFSQAHFEKGYFISRDGNKTTCLIKNEDWISIPSEFKYKLNENAEVQRISQSQINTLEIPSKFLFERHTVDIDRYSKKANDLSDVRTSNFKKESLLLKVIVDGQARLLWYPSYNVDHFYYMLNGTIHPLEYKVFAMKNGSIGKNFNYQKTLREELACQKQPLNSKIPYKKSNLIKYFISYNTCHNSTSKQYNIKAKNGKFNVRAKVSLGINSATISFPQFGDHNFKSKPSFKLGAELEYIFSFNNNKWSLFVEPTYKSVYNSQTDPIFVGTQEVTTSVIFADVFHTYSIDYSSIEIPIGLRHYFYLNRGNILFANIGFNLESILNNDISIKREVLNTVTNFTGNIDSELSYFIGFGYAIQQKYTFELRYNAPRSLKYVLGTDLNQSNFSIAFGYNFL